MFMRFQVYFRSVIRKTFTKFHLYLMFDVWHLVCGLSPVWSKSCNINDARGGREDQGGGWWRGQHWELDTRSGGSREAVVVRPPPTSPTRLERHQTPRPC